MKHFADRLRAARVAVGLTQEQLGFALGVTKSSVSAWENGRETPSFRLLPTLSRTLQRSLDELICAEPPSGNPPGTRHDATAARDEKERALIMRYRNMSARRRAALLDLIRADDP